VDAADTVAGPVGALVTGSAQEGSLWPATVEDASAFVAPMPEVTSRALTVQATKAAAASRDTIRDMSDSFHDRHNALRDEPVRLAVHAGRGIGVRGIDEAEDLAARLVRPVAQVPDAYRSCVCRSARCAVATSLAFTPPSIAWVSMKSAIQVPPLCLR